MAEQIIRPRNFTDTATYSDLQNADNYLWLDTVNKAKKLEITRLATKQSLENETARAVARENEIESLFVMPTEEAVDAWLNAHPPTVQDYSLTNKKLAIGTLNFVTPEMFGAKGDGVTDDTDAINAAMEACSVVLFGKKTYRINPENGGVRGMGGLKCKNGQHLLMYGATLKSISMTASSYEMISVKDKENVCIEGGVIIGDVDIHVGTLGEHGFGISIVGSKNVTVKNVVISRCWGDAIVIGKYGTENGNFNIFVENSELYSCRRQGVSIIEGSNIVLKNCSIHDISGTSPQSAIDIEPNSTDVVDGVIIENVDEYNCVFGFYINGTAGTVKNVAYKDCSIPNGMQTWYVDGLSVTGCKDASLAVGRHTENAIFSRCRKIKSVYIENDVSVVFDVCDFDFKNVTNAIWMAESSEVSKVIKSVKFIDCVFQCDTVTRFVYFNNYQVDEFILENCQINAGGANFFSSNPNGKAIIKGCEISGFSPYNESLVALSHTCTIQFVDNVIKQGSTPTYVFKVFSGGGAYNIFMQNNRVDISWTKFIRNSSSTDQSCLVVKDNLFKTGQTVTVDGTDIFDKYIDNNQFITTY